MPRIIDLIPTASAEQEAIREETDVEPVVSAVIYPKKYSSVAKSFWQHSGEGISSRRAELCHKAFVDGFLVPRIAADGVYHNSGRSATKRSLKGPLRYQKGKMVNGVEDDLSLQLTSYASVPKERRRDAHESAQFVEERYGRNLDFSLAGKAKLAIRRRIAGGLTADVNLNKTAELAHSTMNIRQVPGISEDDVYLFPSGMSSIFNAHRVMMACRGEMRSVCFGFVFQIASRLAGNLLRIGFHTLIRSRSWKSGALDVSSTATVRPKISMTSKVAAREAKGFLLCSVNFQGILF